jgi:acyl-CoA oxidase
VLSYRRMRYLQQELGLRSADLLANPQHLLALHGWTGLIDGTLTTLLTIHYNLCIGSIVTQGEGRAALEPLLAELESMDSIGVFLATELAHGNNVQAMETEAVYDPVERNFVLQTPNARAQKFMPNTGAPGIAKLGVVLARLKVSGRDCGVFPFVVRIRTADGLCEGVRVTLLGEKPDYALDNAVTSFDQVRVPYAHWLSAGESSIDEHGVFSSAVKSRGVRFLKSMDRVQTGKLCLSSCGVTLCSAALQMTLNYASQRKTFSPMGRDVYVLSYRSFQRPVFEAIATTYATALMLQHTELLCRRDGEAAESEINRGLAMCKVFVSSRTIETLSRCRERVGAQGMFSANRIISYLVQSHGVVTAEGDNEILLIKTARELLMGVEYAPPCADAQLATIPMLESVDFLVDLMRARERTLVLRLRGALASGRKRAGVFDSWNEQLSEAVELSWTHAARLALDCYGRVLDQVIEPSARAIVERLMRLFALQEIARFSTALIVDGLLSSELAAKIEPERERIVGELYKDVDLLMGAFRIPMSLLAAPIGEDYLHAYDFLKDVPAESYIRELSVSSDSADAAASL